MAISENKLAKQIGVCPETLRLWRIKYFKLQSPGRGKSIEYTPNQVVKILRIAAYKRKLKIALRDW